MTHSIAIQKGGGYEVHHFEDEATARAFIAVNRISGARRLSAAHGRKLAEVDRTGERFNSRIEELAMTIWTQEEADATPRAPDGTPIGDAPRWQTQQPAATVVRGQVVQRTYRVGPVVKVVSPGQRVGILHATVVVPALVKELHPDHIIVTIDNGPYRRSVERRIDMTTTGIGLTIDKVVSPTD